MNPIKPLLPLAPGQAFRSRLIIQSFTVLPPFLFSPSAKRFASCPCLTRSSRFAPFTGSPGTDVGLPARQGAPSHRQEVSLGTRPPPLSAFLPLYPSLPIREKKKDAWSDPLPQTLTLSKARRRIRPKARMPWGEDTCPILPDQRRCGQGRNSWFGLWKGKAIPTNQRRKM